jgi:GxxExxY protein
MTLKTSRFSPIPDHVEASAADALDAAFHMHRTLGPGLLESVSEACLCRELSKRGIPFESQVELPITYEGLRLEAGLRLDIWIDRQIIFEIKAVEKITPTHQAQLLTYMKLAGSRLGFLIHFNVARLKDGIARRVL